MSELDKKLMQTPDLNKERLEKLKSLFPDLFTVEGKLNPDELKKIIDPDLVKETERFEFKWFGKSEAKRNAFTPSKATLVYDAGRSVNPEYADGNMIIEGENLETLKCLLAGYRERVKCIYIDPPYNTGKDFVYSDKWDESKEDYWEHIGVIQDGVKVDTNLETSGRFHSNWLNMMYSRLLLARQLLREEGVIFISIDDNEVHHLRKLCDEVFGEENFASVFILKSNPRGSQSTSYSANVHEYVLCYVKNINLINGLSIQLSDDMIGEYNLSDENGKYRLLGLRLRGGFWRREERPFLFYTIYTNPTNGDISLEKSSEYSIEVLPIKPSTNEEGTWRWSKEKLLKNKNLIIAKEITREERNIWDIFQKDYLQQDGIQKETKSKTIWDEKEVNYQNGTNEIKQLFEQKNIFDFPKPIFIIKKMIKMTCDDSDIILDFFAGSGTTAHAVVELNKEDGGNRKFILVQIPELTDESSEAYKAGYKKISDITIERNKRVIQKIEKEEKEKNPGLFGEDQKPFKTGFKVYTLAKSNFPRVDFAPDPAKTEEENLALLNQYIDEKEAMYLAMIDEKNIFDEVLLKKGFMLNYSKEKSDGFSKNKVFQIKDDFKKCLICMDMSIANETLKELEQYKDKIFICLERALDTTMKWNLKHLFGEKLIAF